MAFTLTREFMDQLSAAAAKGDFGPYIASVDPDVEWRIGGSEDKGSGREGVYVSWPVRRQLLTCVRG